MPPSYFPLRWESTGDQWWYASPIDWAAANGHFDLVLELLHIDPNLLIKLTSLRRIRRLETVWDDDLRFADVARCRSFVARLLLLECENRSGGNSLLRAGYGGWLLYTAASAGDVGFVKELLLRDPLMVFGEGEFGVTDILYAAARSKNSEVFRILFDNSVSPRCFSSISRQCNETMSVFQQEMLNRAVHAAARGGNLEVLRELLAGCRDVLVYRDAQGSTVLHAASGRGQVEVVKDLIASFDIIDSIDNHGNTSLHVATFRGHLPVVEALIKALPSLIYLTNGTGDTFLHVAIAGFRTSGFRRLDRQMELMRHLISGALVNIEEIINCRNNDGRTILHMTVIGNVHPDLVALLMTIRSIHLNIKDTNGMTPLDLLGQHPRSASSEMLIRQMISAGGVAKSNNHVRRSALASQLRMQGIGNSPGTSFKVSDAEIFLYTGIETSNSTGDKSSGRTSSCSSISKSDLPHPEATEETNASADKKRHSPLSNAANRLRTFIRMPCNKGKKSNGSAKMCDVDPMETLKKCSPHEEMPTSLRERFSKQTSLPNNKRTLAVRSSIPTSPSTKKKIAASLMHGVIETMPHLAPPLGKSPSCSSPRLSVSSTRQKNVTSEIETLEPSSLVPKVKPINGLNDSTPQKSRASGRRVNHYFCFGAQGLSVEDKVTGQRSSRFFRRSALSVS